MCPASMRRASEWLWTPPTRLDEFVQNGKIVGFDADLGEALGKVMGVKVTEVDATFDAVDPRHR